MAHYTSHGEVKPNRGILLEIVRDAGVPPEEVLYFGDSLSRDMSMAIDAKVNCAWAKSGSNCLPSCGVPVLGDEFFCGVVDAELALVGGGHQAGELGPGRSARLTAVATCDLAHDHGGS